MLWITSLLILVILHAPFIKGASPSPCGSDGVQEVLADHETHFTCMGPVEWRLHYYSYHLIQGDYRMTVVTLATCATTCLHINTFDGLFNASTVHNYTTTMIIRPANNTRLYQNVQFVNGSLECTRGDFADKSECLLNYVDPPQGVRCTMFNSSWFVNVSCVISSVYSSRGLYKCHLLRRKSMSESKTLETVTMVTSPTTKKITKNEVKVAGSCHFVTELPVEKGNYGFLVSFSPGGRTFVVQDKWFAVEQPGLPVLSCDPQPYVLENTNVTCTCRTTSPGQPAGYLRGITGNQTEQSEPVTVEPTILTPGELHFTQSLTLSDHGHIWFSCHIIWGQNTIRGKNYYTASVGYIPRTAKISVNGHERSETVKEGDQIHFRCESDGRPTPNISIINNDNNNVIFKGFSVTNYTTIARCEYTATYTCSAWNEFSHHVTTSSNLQLDVECIPRSTSSTNLINIKIKEKREELNFDVISFPAPAVSGVWFAEQVINSSELSYVKIFEVNASCKSDSKYRYISKCTLTMLGNAYHSRTGLYKIEVTNKHGDENFTVEYIQGRQDNSLLKDHLTVLGFASGGSLFISVVAVLVLVMRKRMKAQVFRGRDRAVNIGARDKKNSFLRQVHKGYGKVLLPHAEY